MRHYDLAVIGTGSGLIIIEEALKLGRICAVVEKDLFGGTCLNRGCIPSKMLVYPADLIREAEQGERIGVSFSKPQVDWALMTKRMREQTDENISLEKSLNETQGLTLYKGEGRFIDANTLSITLKNGGSESFTAEQIVIATGGRTRIPPILGLENTGYITSESFFGNRFPDKPYVSLLIIGGGTIACEFAHILSALGTKVTMAVRSETILREFDAEIGPFVSKALEAAGIRVIYFAVPEAARVEKDLKIVEFVDKRTGERFEVSTQELLLASGIVPNTERLNLDTAGVQTLETGYIPTDDRMRTNVPHIWALGDVNGKYQLRHKANYEADVLNDNLLHSGVLRADYSSVPQAAFTYPQAAGVGLSEQAARRLYGEHVRVFYNHYSDVVAGRAMGFQKHAADDGFAKIILDDTQRVLGVHIVGPQAAALVQPYAYLMNAGGKAQADHPGTWLPVRQAMTIHPSFSELAAWALAYPAEGETPG
jgi:mycothione reductase